ncbi:MAG: RIP metalloprotease RseP [Alphaproteobacteria bacterium]|nr:RIP metalloprotease RseP [Alphaproteobacteria bacterium]
MEWLVNTVYYVVPFLILLGILVFVHEFGHFIVARKLGVAVSAFSIGFGKELWSKTDKKGTVWKLSAIPLGGYCQFLGDADESSSTSEVDLSKYSKEEQKHLFATQSPIKKLAIAIAGPLFNYLFAFFVFFGLFFAFGSYSLPPIVSDVIKDSPAEKAGIMIDDKILEINGIKINDWSDIHKEVSVSVDTASLKIERGNEIIELVIPLETMDYAFDETEKPVKRKMIGIKGEAKRFQIVKDNFNFTKSFVDAAKEVYSVTDMTLRGVGQMLTGERSSEDVGGIIRIAEMSGDISKSRSFWDFLSFMALLSINLGLINLFPIPLLDGGHVVIYLLEIVSGRQLNTKVKDYLFKIGLGFILFLMVFATWNDITHLITRWFE